MSAQPMVRGLVAETLGVDPALVTAATTQRDLPEWDSVGHLNIMLSLEEEIDVVLDVEEMIRLTSIPAIVAYVERVRPSS
ncbi:MAG TPA: acyl carrier protein [Gemmatimonadaceae bacterium]|nr:acyl carrier protein [Gemmatimonadaceae bacterium]